ncbi:MAG: short-chain dehydrogenase [Subtercola sp.]|jgi:NAD(P)-dependent dehydrogenase (short-subunit alcohol dehydrogenase family)|nr:short-chain dehydrogenase [Subtercola sp.]
MSSTQFDMNGQVVIVTGSGRGLGREYALDFARRGAAVVINDVAKDESGDPRGASVVAEIEQLGGQAVVSDHDIMTSEGARGLVATAIDRWGRVDAIVNNAGFLRPGFINDLTDEKVEQVVTVHLLAAMHTTRAVWPHMQAQGYGRIVFTSSASSFGHAGNTQYAAAKGAMIGLARSLAEEAQADENFDFRVNSIMPQAQSVIAVENPLPGSALAETRKIMDLLTPRRTPRSVAPMVVYLASRECSVNGEAFTANSGRYARVVYGVTQGWIAQAPNETVAEDISDHIDEITDASDIYIPQTMHDETAQVYDRLIAAGLI